MSRESMRKYLSGNKNKNSKYLIYLRNEMSISFVIAACLYGFASGVLYFDPMKDFGHTTLSVEQELALVNAFLQMDRPVAIALLVLAFNFTKRFFEMRDRVKELELSDLG